MNARAYFTILRPWRTLLLAQSYVGFIYLWLRTLFHAPTTEALALLLAVFGPAVLGSMMLGPLHEAMHRSFFPLLPDARRQLRRWHLRTLAVVGLLFFVPAALFVRAVPAPALIGLIGASLSIPLLNRRQRIWGPARPQFPILLALGIILASVGRQPVIALCHAAPWAVGFAGLGFAALCFRSGFSSQNTRDRWRDPLLYCTQSTLPFIGTDILLHAQAQGRQFLLEQNATPARDWSSTNVGSSLRDWMQVVNHARFGRLSRHRQLCQIMLTGLCIGPFLFGITFGMAKLGGASLAFVELSRLLAEAGKPGGSIDHPQVGMIFALAPLAACVLALLAAITASAPASPLPISRERLAACLFANATRLGSCVFAASCLGFLLTLVAASWIAGTGFAFESLTKPLAAHAILLPAIILGFGIYFLRNTAVRLLSSIVIGLGSVLAVVATEIQFSAAVLSLAGLLACGAATVVSGWLSWLVVRRYFCTCDLARPCDWMRKLGIGLA